MRLFEDFFDDIDDDKLVDDNSSEEIARLSETGDVNVALFTHYFMFRYEPKRRFEWNDRNFDRDGDFLNIKYLYKEVGKIVDDMDFTDDFYLDKPIMRSRAKLKTGELEFDTFQFEQPFPSKFNILTDIPGDRVNNSIYSPKALSLEFYIYFDKNKLIHKTYKQYMRMMMRFCERINTIFSHGRDGAVYDLKFYENNRSKEDIKKFENNGTQLTSSQSFELGNTEPLDNAYRKLYEDNDIPEDANGYDTTDKINYWHKQIRENFDKNFNNIVVRGIKLAEIKYGVILKLFAISKNNQISDDWRDKSYGTYVIFAMTLKEGTTIESNTIDECLAACFMNIIPTYCYQPELKYIIAVRPVNCTIKNSFLTTGRDKQNKRKIFKNTPREMRIENMEYRVDGTKKEYCSQWDNDAKQDANRRWYKTVWNSTNKMSERLRECSYVNYGAGTSAYLVYLDNKGMVMRNAMKCSFYGNGILQWFIQTVLPILFNFKYKDDNK